MKFKPMRARARSITFTPLSMATFALILSTVSKMQKMLINITAFNFFVKNCVGSEEIY